MTHRVFQKHWKGADQLSKKTKNYNRRAGTPSLIAGLTLALIAAVVALFMSYNSSKGDKQTPTANNNSNNSSPQALISSSDSNAEIKAKPVERDGLEVRYLDVGQGDCALIMLPDGKNVLIDAGPNSSADYVVDYLRNAGIERIDFLIATHPHEDHIGGMDEVINNFEIGRIYAPKLEQSDESLDSDTESSKSAAVTTKTYESFLKAVSDKGLKIINGKGGTHIYFSLSLTIDLIAPNNDEYSDVNNYSLVVQMKYGQQSFLFMGDAESYSEQEILDGGYNLKSDIIKIGHHGSSSSTSKAFIEKVEPRYAVISCGEGNQYGHPHTETLKTLEESAVKVFRTDLNGVITVKCDGLNDFVVTAEKENIAETLNSENSESSDISKGSVGDSEASNTENSSENNNKEDVSENSDDTRSTTESLAA